MEDIPRRKFNEYINAAARKFEPNQVYQAPAFEEGGVVPEASLDEYAGRLLRVGAGGSDSSYLLQIFEHSGVLYANMWLERNAEGLVGETQDIMSFYSGSWEKVSPDRELVRTDSGLVLPVFEYFEKDGVLHVKKPREANKLVAGEIRVS